MPHSTKEQVFKTDEVEGVSCPRKVRVFLHSRVAKTVSLVIIVLYSLWVLIGSAIGELHNPGTFSWGHIVETVLLVVIVAEFFVHTAFDLRKVRNLWHIADFIFILLMIILMVVEVCTNSPDASAVFKIRALFRMSFAGILFREISKLKRP